MITRDFMDDLEKTLDNPDGDHFKLFMVGMYKLRYIEERVLNEDAKTHVNFARQRGLMWIVQERKEGEKVNVVTFTPLGLELMKIVCDSWWTHITVQKELNPEEFRS